MTPLITVLMAVHNGGVYLKDAVDSVLNQEFKDFELLIVDDCSSDEAIEAVAQFKDPRIRIHRNQVNVGQTASLNLGLSLAKGRWIARMDADDMAYPGWLKHSEEYLRHHDSCAVLGCAAVVMDGQGRVYKKLRTPSDTPHMILKSFFASPLNHVGVLMDRDTILANGAYDASLRIAADFDLWSRLLRKRIPIQVLPTTGVKIRAHMGSVTAVHKGRADVPEICKIVKENIHHFTSMDLKEEPLKDWCLFIYAPQELAVQNFLNSENLMTDVYQRINPEQIGCTSQDVHQFLCRQRRIFFIKGLFAFSQRGDYEGLKQLTDAFLKKYGIFSFYGLLWVLSGRGQLGGVLAALYALLRKAETVSQRQ